MDDAVCIRTYDTYPKKTYPKQVALAEGGTMVIGGSDDGFIHVFDKATSERVQTLRHSSVGQVQTVTVRQAILPLATTDAHMKTHDTGDVQIIVAATSSNENNIYVEESINQASRNKRGTYRFIHFVGDSASCHTFGGHGCDRNICTANDGM